MDADLPPGAGPPSGPRGPHGGPSHGGPLPSGPSGEPLPHGGPAPPAEETIRSADGTPLFLRRFPAEHEAAVLVFLHGLGAHSGWFRAMGRALAALGVTSYAFDYPGHGRSGGPRGDVRDIDEVFHALDAVADRAAAEHPGRPLFVGGISLGGLLALRAAQLAPGRPGERAASRARGFVALAVPVADRYIPLSRKIAIFGVLLVRPDALYPTPLGLSVPITGSAGVQEVLRADPLGLRAVTARTYFQILRALLPVVLRPDLIRPPVLLLQGGRDRVVKPGAVRWLFRRLGSRDKTLHVYDRLGHDLKLEPEMPLVAADIASWIATRGAGLPSPPGARPHPSSG